MDMKFFWIVVFCLSVGIATADDQGMQTAAAKNAKSEHDKAVAKATADYRKQLEQLDKSYINKLDQLQNSPQVQKSPGEKDRIEAEENASTAEYNKCADQSFQVVMVVPEAVEKPSQLKKGMTKKQLLALFPKPPTTDMTDAGGNEIIQWDIPGNIRRNFGGVQFDPSHTDLSGSNAAPAIKPSITTVSVQNGVVVDFNVTTSN